MNLERHTVNGTIYVVLWLLNCGHCIIGKQEFTKKIMQIKAEKKYIIYHNLYGQYAFVIMIEYYILNCQ